MFLAGYIAGVLTLAIVISADLQWYGGVVLSIVCFAISQYFTNRLLD